MNVFRVFLGLAWLAIAGITVEAYVSQGMIAGDLFFTDIAAMTWRSQFDVDLLAHLIVVGLWGAWRHRFRPIGVLLGVLCVIGGGLISLAYLAAVTFQAQGDVRLLLVGEREPKSARLP